MSLQTRLTALAQAIGADIKLLVPQPVAGVKIVEQFIYTDPSVARPLVPPYVSLNWTGPANTSGNGPTNMASGDTWDMEA